MWQYGLQVAFNKVDDAVPHTVKRVVKRFAGGRVRWLYQTITRITPDEVAEVSIQAGPLKGRKFNCNLKYERDFFLGTHEPEVVDVFERVARPGDTVIDVGGHTGYFALVLARCVGPAGRVITFEPSVDNLTLLRLNLDLNADLAACITVRTAAVTDRSGDVTFERGQHRFTGHIVDTPTAEAQLTSAVAVDDVVADEHLTPSLVKMDIEGGETRALPGLVRTLNQHQPTLVVEVHDETAHRSFLDVLNRTGYTARVVGGETWSPEPTWTERVQFEARARAPAR